MATGLIGAGHDGLHAVVCGYGNSLLVWEHRAQLVPHEAEKALAVTLAKDEQRQVNQEGHHNAGVAICTSEIFGAKICDISHEKVSALARIEEAGPRNGNQEHGEKDGSQPHVLEARRW